MREFWPPHVSLVWELLPLVAGVGNDHHAYWKPAPIRRRVEIKTMYKWNEVGNIVVCMEFLTGPFLITLKDLMNCFVSEDFLSMVSLCLFIDRYRAGDKGRFPSSPVVLRSESNHFILIRMTTSKRWKNRKQRCWWAHGKVKHLGNI